MDTFVDKLQSILDRTADRLPDTLLTLIIGIAVIEIAVPVANKIMKAFGVRAGMRKILKSLLRAFLYVVLFVALIEALGLNSIFVALTGSTVILALLLSTGVAPLVTDILSGLFLGHDREFQPGAKVQAGDRSAEGEIVSMDIRKVYLRDKQGKLHVLPNSLVEKNEWIILKSVNDHPKKRRLATKRR